MNKENVIRAKGAWRVTVRLDPERAALLQKLSESSGCDPSSILRQALDQVEVSSRLGITSSSVPLPPPVMASDTTPRVATVPLGANRSATRMATPQQAPERSSAVTVPRPSNILELLSQYRAYGSKLRSERRRLFKRLFCVAVIAQENSENPRDRQLHNELLHLGRDFGLFD
jgi:hypothetical protein